MFFSPIYFCTFLEEFPPPSLTNVFFQGYSFLKVLSDTYICGYWGFNKIGLLVKNSTLRFYHFPPVLFCYQEEYFLMNKTQYKLLFRGSRPKVFYK